MWVCPNGCTGSMDLSFGHGCSVDRSVKGGSRESGLLFEGGGWLLTSSIKQKPVDVRCLCTLPSLTRFPGLPGTNTLVAWTSSCLGHECLVPWIHRPAGIRTWLLRPNGCTGSVDDRSGTGALSNALVWYRHSHVRQHCQRKIFSSSQEQLTLRKERRCRHVRLLCYRRNRCFSASRFGACCDRV